MVGRGHGLDSLLGKDWRESAGMLAVPWPSLCSCPFSYLKCPSLAEACVSGSRPQQMNSVRMNRDIPGGVLGS